MRIDIIFHMALLTVRALFSLLVLYTFFKKKGSPQKETVPFHTFDVDNKIQSPYFMF